jgi:hypothetical protein
MLHPSKKTRTEEEALLYGDPRKIGGNAVAWDGPNHWLNLAAKRLQIMAQKNLDLAERMRKLKEAFP